MLRGAIFAMKFPREAWGGYVSRHEQNYPSSTGHCSSCFCSTERSLHRSSDWQGALNASVGAVMQAISMSGAMRLSLSQQPPQANVKHLIRRFDPHCASHPPGQLPPARWMDVPFDIMREVVQRLAVHDVQTTLLVCREWHDGFSNGVVSLKPRLLKLEELAYRLDKPLPPYSLL